MIVEMSCLVLDCIKKWFFGNCLSLNLFVVNLFYFCRFFFVMLGLLIFLIVNKGVFSCVKGVV